MDWYIIELIISHLDDISLFQYLYISRKFNNLIKKVINIKCKNFTFTDEYFDEEDTFLIEKTIKNKEYLEFYYIIKTQYTFDVNFNDWLKCNIMYIINSILDFINEDKILILRLLLLKLLPIDICTIDIINYYKLIHNSSILFEFYLIYGIIFNNLELVKGLTCITIWYIHSISIPFDYYLKLAIKTNRHKNIINYLDKFKNILI